MGDEFIQKLESLELVQAEINTRALGITNRLNVLETGVVSFSFCRLTNLNNQIFL